MLLFVSNSLGHRGLLTQLFLSTSTAIMILLQHFCSPVEANSRPYDRSEYICGNLALGGLFKLTSGGNGGFSWNGAKSFEAMLFAVDRINADDSILPNITLGAQVLQLVTEETSALDLSLKEFILGESDHLNDKVCAQNRTLGVIGPPTSDQAMYITKILNVFQIPLISSGATSPELSDKTNYEYFSRTVPSDVFQTKAIVELLLYFNWTHVSVLYTDDGYGRLGFKFLKKEAEKHGICIAVEGMVPALYNASTQSPDVIAKLAKEFAEHNTTEVVVLFCKGHAILPLLADMNKDIKTFKQIQFVGSETLGKLHILKNIPRLATGLIYTQWMSNPVKEFDEYFFNLNADKKNRSTWFKAFYEQVMDCSFENKNEGDVCNSSETLGSKLKSTGYLFDSSGPVIDAVYAFAHALHQLQKESCLNNSSICKPLSRVSGKSLLQTIRKINFTSLTRHDVYFDKNGDVDGGYSIYHVQGDKTNTLEYLKIGEWDGELHMNSSLWPRELLTVQPRHAEHCDAHQIQRLIVPNVSCSYWECEECPNNAVVSANKTTCLVCEDGYTPDKNQNACIKIYTKYYSLDGLVPPALVLPPLLLSASGILAVGFTLSIFIRFNNAPLVKASGRELCYLLLFGLFLSYLFPLVSVCRPSLQSCFLQFMLDSLPITISYVAIAVKTNRVYRIFDTNRTITIRPSYTRPFSQIVLSLGLTCVQILVLSALVILDFPKDQLVYVSSTELHLVCSTSNTAVVLPHIYNIVLMVSCTYYGFKARNIPGKFNEARHIAMAIGCTCLIVITTLILSMVTASRFNKIYQLAIHCYRVTIMSTILLVCFFAPKVYIILFKREQGPTVDDKSVLTREETQNTKIECPHCGRTQTKCGSTTGAKSNKMKKEKDQKDQRRWTF